MDSGGEILGEGATTPRPGPHAETIALEVAGVRANGATLYCTLEPHQYYSHVAPCTDAIVASGIKRVSCPVVDPTEPVNGKGFAALRNAGIEVSTDVQPELAKRAARLIEPFAKLVATGMPFVTCKWGMSLDGSVATRTGDSKWISSPEWFRHTHKVRYGSDAIVTGIGTVLADDPAMTARDTDTGERLACRPRLRVVVDSDARLPANARMLDETGDVLHATAVAGSPSDRVERVCLPYRADGDSRPRVDLHRLFALLGERGYANIMIDAGPTLTGELLRLRLVDKVIASISTHILIGGDGAKRVIGGDGPAKLSEAPTLRDVETFTLGRDMVIEGYVQYPKEQ